MALWLEFSKRTGERLTLEVTRLLHQQQTEFQKLEIADTVPFGRALFLDDKIQSSELDEFIYHEALVHPAMLLHPEPRSVLVVGGGEGATLAQALRHRSVRRAVMIDIDRAAVAACREHLSAWHRGAFDDPRAELVFDDARAYLERCGETFDVVVVDVTDPLAGGPSYRIFTREFYQLVADHLSERGALAVQAESVDPGVNDAHLVITRTISTVFPYAASYQAHVSSFGESWGFVAASKSRDPRALDPAEIDRRLAERGLDDLRFYDGETHLRLFNLPKFLREQLRAERPVVTDDAPVFVV